MGSPGSDPAPVQIHFMLARSARTRDRACTAAGTPRRHRESATDRPQLLLKLRIARQVHGDAAEKDRRRHEADHEHLAHTPREQRFREMAAPASSRAASSELVGIDVRGRAVRAGVPRSLQPPSRRAARRRRQRCSCRRIPRLSHRPAPFATDTRVCCSVSPSHSPNTAAGRGLEKCSMKSASPIATSDCMSERAMRRVVPSMPATRAAPSARSMALRYGRMVRRIEMQRRPATGGGRSRHHVPYRGDVQLRLHQDVVDVLITRHRPEAIEGSCCAPPGNAREGRRTPRTANRMSRGAVGSYSSVAGMKGIRHAGSGEELRC